mmetsp:Transcript_7031/g.17078  ORF Transcript_7031/g.17078 Transcript_7031/m.17078 type:complete len:367 (-) Transcript_7031:1538-2638(-)
MTLPVRVHGWIDHAEFLEDLPRLVVHAAGSEGAGDPLQQLRRVGCRVSVDDHGRLGGEAALDVQLDGLEVVALTLLQLASLLLLSSRHEPLQEVQLELLHVGVVLLLSQTDALVVPVQLLVHGHGALEVVVVQQQCLGTLKLLRQHRQLCLDEVVSGSVAPKLSGMGFDNRIHFLEIRSLGNVPEHGVAALCDRQLGRIIVECCLSQLPPQGLRLGRQGQLTQQHHSLSEESPFNASAERDECLVEFVLLLPRAVVNQHNRPTFGPLDVFYVALDLSHGHPVGLLYRIPDAEVLSVLRDDDIAVGHPLDVVAVVEEGGAALLLQRVQVQLTAVVAEQQPITSGVEFQPVDATVVVDSGQRLAIRQI